MDYKFAIGQGVKYSPRGEREAAFVILRQMPEDDNVADDSYRIKSKAEGFERVVMEYDLSRVVETPEKAARRAYLARD